MAVNLISLNFRSYSAWARGGGQVNKDVEITGFEIYCSTFQGDLDLMTLNNAGNSNFWADEEGSGGKCFESLFAPCDVSLSLLVCNFGFKSFFHFKFFILLFFIISFEP